MIQLAEITNDTGMLPALRPWDTPAIEVVEKADSFSEAEAVARLEEDVWQGRIHSSAAQRTRGGANCSEQPGNKHDFDHGGSAESRSQRTRSCSVSKVTGIAASGQGVNAGERRW